MEDRKWEKWKSLSEEQLADIHLRIGDPDHNAWWICHWQWRGSKYWRRLCDASEAIQLMAWESLGDPALEPHEEQLYADAATLNRFVGSLGRWQEAERKLRKQIYWLKRGAVKNAMLAGLAFIRLIEARVICHSCNGTGDFHSYDLRHEKCRKCGGTGQAKLSFIEVNIANRWTFHQPFDHTHPFKCESVNWLQPRTTLWRPNEKIGGGDIDITGPYRRLRSALWLTVPNYTYDIYEYMQQDMTLPAITVERKESYADHTRQVQGL